MLNLDFLTANATSMLNPKFKLALDAFLDQCFSPHTNPHNPDKAPGFDSLIKLALLAISHIIGRRQNTLGPLRAEPTTCWGW